MRTIYRIAAFAASILAAASCIYPFDANVEGVADRLVIEGDMIVGEMSQVRLSYMYPLNATTTDIQSPPLGDAYFEDEQGTVYKHNKTVPAAGLSVFNINTKNAPADRRYRLHVKIKKTGKEYVSSWLTVNKAPVVDSLSYSVGEKNLAVKLSAHSVDGGQYFRWTYDEIWRFHAAYPRDYYFDTTDSTEVAFEETDYSTYWCFAEASSSEVDLCATSDLVEDRLIDHKFKEISRTDDRLMDRYKMTVNVRCISADAYRYLANLKLTSNFTGSLFSPNPSDVVGNIVCLDDPDELVIGYIDACMNTPFTYYIDNKQTKAHISVLYSFPFVPEVNPSEGVYLIDYWLGGYVPVTEGTDVDGKTGILWDYKRCVDCRLMGGKIQEPAGWN